MLTIASMEMSDFFCLISKVLCHWHQFCGDNYVMSVDGCRCWDFKIKKIVGNSVTLIDCLTPLSPLHSLLMVQFRFVVHWQNVLVQSASLGFWPNVIASQWQCFWLNFNRENSFTEITHQITFCLWEYSASVLKMILICAKFDLRYLCPLYSIN